MDIKVQPLYGAPETGTIHLMDIEDKFATKAEVELIRMQIDNAYAASKETDYLIYGEIEVLREKRDKQEKEIKSLQKRLNYMYIWFSILAVAMSTALAALAFAVK